jgi:hypothetical protein
MVWLVVDCSSREWKQRQPDNNNSNAMQRLLRCQRRDKDCDAASLSRRRQRERRWWHCFCYCFCSSALWGHVVPSFPAADIGVTATSVAVVLFVGAVIPQAETKTARRRQQRREDACVASAGTTTATQRQSGVALTVRAMLALSRNVLVPALRQ